MSSSKKTFPPQRLSGQGKNLSKLTATCFRLPSSQVIKKEVPKGKVKFALSHEMKTWLDIEGNTWVNLKESFLTKFSSTLPKKRLALPEMMKAAKNYCGNVNQGRSGKKNKQQLRIHQLEQELTVQKDIVSKMEAVQDQLLHQLSNALNTRCSSCDNYSFGLIVRDDDLSYNIE